MTYDIAPAPGNPRNSEGDTAFLTNGHLMLTWTRFTGPEDHACADIPAIFSTDRGTSWSEPRVLVSADEAQQNVMSVSLLREHSTGDLLLFYLRKNGTSDLQVRLRRSRDEGASWGASQAVSTRPGYNVMNNARAVQLASGRLLAPVAWVADLAQSHHQTAFCYCSDDAGATWRMGRGETSLPQSRVGCQEPGLVELPGGQGVFMIIRTDQGCVYAARSQDEGNTWSSPEPLTDLPAPASPATVSALPDGSLLITYNHRSDGAQAGWQDRTPLAAARSQDGGRSWHRLADIEPSAECAYAYTSMRVWGDRLVLTYYVWPRSIARGFDQTTLRFRVLPLSRFMP
jgi:sialidase-1